MMLSTKKRRMQKARDYARRATPKKGLTPFDVIARETLRILEGKLLAMRTHDRN